MSARVHLTTTCEVELPSGLAVLSIVRRDVKMGSMKFHVKRVKVRRLEAEGRNEIVDEMMRCM